MKTRAVPFDVQQAYRLVASLGGQARAAKLSPACRSAIAKKAAKARWRRLKKSA